MIPVTNMRPPFEPETVGIADLIDHSHRNLVWFLVAPAAVAGDIVTFPLQLLFALFLWDGC